MDKYYDKEVGSETIKNTTLENEEETELYKKGKEIGKIIMKTCEIPFLDDLNLLQKLNLQRNELQHGNIRLRPKQVALIIQAKWGNKPLNLAIQESTLDRPDFILLYENIDKLEEN